MATVVSFMGLATTIVVVVDFGCSCGFCGFGYGGGDGGGVSGPVVVDFGCGGFGWVISDVFWFWFYLVLAPVGCRGGGLLGLWLFVVVAEVRL